VREEGNLGQTRGDGSSIAPRLDLESQLYRVRWRVWYSDEDPLGLQGRLQSISEEGWTVFSILAGMSVVAYRYEVDEDE
jgi:hypothetical protein